MVCEPRRIGLTFALVCLGPGCSGSNPDSGIVVESEGEDGVARPIAAPVLAAIEEMRIDGHEAGLVPIGSMQVADDGTIAVLQQQDRVVRFFNADGESIGSVGGEGAGPGEFSLPQRIGWVGDTLWVEDWRLRRFSLISRTAEFIRTVPRAGRLFPSANDTSAYPEMPLVMPRAFYADGSMLVFAGGTVNTIYPDGWDPERNPYVRARLGGEIDRIVARTPRDDGNVSGVSVSATGGTVYWGRQVPFASEPRTEVSPDGARIVTLETPSSGLSARTYRITIQDASGDTLFTRTLLFESERISGRAADSALAVAVDRNQFVASKRLYEAEMRKRMPSEYPAVEAVLVSNDHRVWLGLRETPEGRPWLVLDAAGEWWGRVVLPPNTTVAAARAAQVWTLERDEWDVQSIVRYRLEPSG